MFIQIIKDLLEDALAERQDLFLIDFTASNDNAIKIIIDGDNGVKVEDCIFVSRAIEHNIDRDEHDFALEVMSAGATAPLTLARQYPKHLGRKLEVKTATQTIEGDLTNVNDDVFTLEWKAREPKPIGKGKVTVNKKESIAYKDVVEAKVIIKF
ncbi:ribosome assembly cofactor RimP [Olleya sp. R77988]|uniref:ribosome assembly cofactor RimP n=1 Tax=Olleya sp. R77988 TaxID=3093875 RepID=UPI0037CB6FBB